MSVLLSPTRILAVYGVMASMVYIETDGFRKEAPFLFVLPVLALAALTLTLSMRPKPKYFTAASFFVIACALYVFTVNRRELGLVCLLVTVSHCLYLLSFMAHVRRVWLTLAVALSVYLIALLYHCFADLFTSIPTLVIASSLHICVAAAAVLAAGSIWHYGSKDSSAHQADTLRFIGMLTCLACSSTLLLNQFGARFDKSNYALSILYYVSQALLFLANERAF